MFNNNDISPDFLIVLGYFKDNFNNVYRNLDGWQKRAILYFVPSMFNRWYFSSLIPETFLSPANIYSERLFGKTDKSPTNGIGISIIVGSPLEDVDFSFFPIDYAFETHPIINDLKILCDFINPDISLDDNNQLFREDADKFLSRLSIADIFYANFLISIAIKLNLISPMLCIYTNKVQVSNNCDILLAQNPKILFTDIFNAALDICSSALCNEFPTAKEILSKSDIFSFLKETISTDDIILNIFSLLGINIDSISVQNFNLKSINSEIESIYLSTTLFIGTRLDKWFLSVFGTYLRIIEPLYAYPLNFKEELNYLYNSITLGNNTLDALFLPCTRYSLTPLGYNTVFNESLPSEPALDKNLVSIEQILSILAEQNHKISLVSNLSDKKISKRVLLCFRATMKCKSIKCKSIKWKDIQIDGNGNLHSLATFIFNSFAIDTISSYTLKILRPKINCIEYVIGDYEMISLNDLALDLGSRIIFNYNSHKSIEIRLIGKGKCRSQIIYPRITNQSNEYNS